jgi:hypothetical protein
MRTESGPGRGSALRAKTRHDFDANNPIIGYSLDARTYKVENDMPRRSEGFIYAYVSLDSTSYASGNVAWRGDLSDALIIAALFAADPEESAKYEALFGADIEELRDPDWYYMPGRWVRGLDGVVRHSFVVERDGKLIYKVVAERISEVTLSSRSR